MWEKDRNQSKADFSAVCWWRCSVKPLTIKSLWYALLYVCFATLRLLSIWKSFKLNSPIWIVPYRIPRKFALDGIQTQGKHTGRMRMFQIYTTILWYYCCIPESIFILHRSSSAIICPLVYGLTFLWPRSCYIEMLINIFYWMYAFVIVFYVGKYDCTRILSWTETILYF